MGAVAGAAAALRVAVAAAGVGAPVAGFRRRSGA